MSAPAGRKDIFRKGLNPEFDGGYGIPLQDPKNFRINIIRPRINMKDWTLGAAARNNTESERTARQSFNYIH
jgi:hypothetical protein